MRKYYGLVIKVVLLMQSIISISITAQPYIYEQGSIVDSTYKMHPIVNIDRIDLSTGERTVFIDTAGFIGDLKWDKNGEYLFIVDHLGGLRIIKSSNSNHIIDIRQSNITFIGSILYNETNDRYYVFSNPRYGDISEYLSEIDLNSAIIQNKAILPELINSGNDTNEEAFLSKDGKRIYFAGEDTLTNDAQIVVYSTETDQIIERRYIKEIFNNESKFFQLIKGFGDIAIILKNLNNRFNIYNLASDSLICEIKYDIWASPFIDKEAKYLTLFDHGIESEYNGKVSIYNAKDGSLLKKLELPPNGKVYQFDNYPDKLFYYLGTESRTIVIDLKFEETQTNLALNPGFEDGTKSYWFTSNTYGNAEFSFEVRNESPIAGSYSGKFSITKAGTSNNRPMFYFKIKEKLIPGNKYTYRFKTKVIIGEPKIMYLNYGAGLKLFGNTLSGTQIWQYEITPTTNLEYIYFYMDGKSEGVMLIDDFEIIKP